MAPLTTQVMLMSLPAFIKISRVPVMAAMGTVGQEKVWLECESPFLSLCFSLSVSFYTFSSRSPLTFLPSSPLHSFYLQSHYHNFQSFSPSVLTPLPSLFTYSQFPSLTFSSLSLSIPFTPSPSHSPSYTHSPSQLTDHFESESSGYLGLRGHLTLVHP